MRYGRETPHDPVACETRNETKQERGLLVKKGWVGKTVSQLEACNDLSL